MLRFTYSLRRISFGFLLSLVLVTAGVTNAAVAAETKKGAPKTVPNKLLQKIHGQYEGKLKEIAALAAAEEEKIRKVASKKEMLRLKQMAAEAKKISDMRAGKSRTSAIAAFNKKNRNFGRELEKRAGITTKSRQEFFAKVYPKRPLNRTKDDALVSTSPYNIVYPSGNSGSSTTTTQGEIEHDFETDSFPIELTDKTCGGLGFSNEDESSDLLVQAMSFTYSIAVVGGCSQMQLIGTYVRVPAGTTRAKYRIEIPRGYELNASAFGFMAISIAGANFGTMVQGPRVETTSVAESLFVVAPLAYIMQAEKSQSAYVLSGEFVPDRAGGEYLIGAYVEASALSFGSVLGLGIGTGTSDVKRVRHLTVDYD